MDSNEFYHVNIEDQLSYVFDVLIATARSRKDAGLCNSRHWAVFVTEAEKLSAYSQKYLKKENE